MSSQDPVPLPLKFVGYGDESITAHAIVYSAAVFSVQKRSDAEAALSAAKQSIGLTDTDRIHCKNMFGNDARRKTCWGRVTPEKISLMLERLCESLVPIQERPISFMMPRSGMTFKPLEPEEKPTSLEGKGIASIGCNAVYTILVERYGYGAINLCIDPDATKIPWLDGKQKQAQNTKGNYISLGPHIEPPRVSPQIGDPKTHCLLEIAALYAYISAQSASSQGGWKSRWWLELFRVINPEIVRFNPASGTRLT